MEPNLKDISDYKKPLDINKLKEILLAMSIGLIMGLSYSLINCICTLQYLH